LVLSQEILGIDGAAFSAELRFTRLKFWLLDEGKTKSVRTSDVQSVAIQPNGYIKIVVRYGKDLTIPTSSSEAVQLVKAVNALISEITSVELRKKGATREKPDYGQRPKWQRARL